MATKTQKSDERGKPAKDAAVHLVFGEEEYLVSTSAKDLVHKLCPPAEQAFGLEIIEARVDNSAEAVSVIQRAVEALQTIGFMGGRKVVWLKDANFLGGSPTSETVDVKTRLEDLTAMIKKGLPPGQILVISALKVDGRSAFFKACQAGGAVTKFEVPAKSYQVEQQARDRAMQAMREHGLAVREGVLEELLGRTGTDTRQIVQEIEKLAVYMGKRREVTVDDIREIISHAREALAWDLADAVGNRDLPAALKVLRQLMFQGENVVAVIAGLEHRIKDLMLYRECMDRRWLNLEGSPPWQKAAWRSGADVDAALGGLAKDPRQANPYRAGILGAQARKFTREQLSAAQKLVLDTHEQLFVSAVPKELMLELLVLKLLGPVRKAGNPQAGATR